MVLARRPGNAVWRQTLPERLPEVVMYISGHTHVLIFTLAWSFLACICLSPRPSLCLPVGSFLVQGGPHALSSRSIPCSTSLQWASIIDHGWDLTSAHAKQPTGHPPAAAYLDHEPSSAVDTSSAQSSPADVRHSHLYHAYPGHPGQSNYPPPPHPSSVSIPSVSIPPPPQGRHPHGTVATVSSSRPPSPGAVAFAATKSNALSALSDTALFTSLPEARKRKFILVDDASVKGGRVRVRVTLDSVNTEAIPDSFRKSNSVYPRSWWGTEMGLDVPSEWVGDYDGDDDGVEVEGRHAHRRGGRRGVPSHADKTVMVSVPTGVDGEAQIRIPRVTRDMREQEVKLNDLGFRMTWLQSRVFSGRGVFLQRSRKSLATVNIMP